MSNESAIALVLAGMLIAAVLGWKNSRTEQQNAELFRSTGELKSPRYLVIVFLGLGLLSGFLSVVTDHHRVGDATWPMGLFGLAGLVFVWIRSFWGVRLDPDAIRFGWRCRRAIAYTDIAELVRESDGRSAVFLLMLRSGARRRLGGSLSCERLFIDELQKRSACAVTYRLRGGVVPEPEWLALQSGYEKFKSGARK